MPNTPAPTGDSPGGAPNLVNPNPPATTGPLPGDATTVKVEKALAKRCDELYQSIAELRVVRANSLNMLNNVIQTLETCKDRSAALGDGASEGDLEIAGKILRRVTQL